MQQENHPGENQSRYAGFWRRFIAFLIDYNIVAICLFPVLIAVDSVAPDHVVIDTPFGLFAQERVLESQKGREEHPDGSVTAVETRILERTYLDKWRYHYREEVRTNAGQSETQTTLIDSVSGEPLDRTTRDELAILVLLIYLTFMESSRRQASLGKLVLAIRVADEEGRRLTVLRSLARNVSKILSAMTLMIGFMMAGWTRRKQGLHDMVASCLVLKRDGLVREMNSHDPGSIVQS